MTPRTRKIAMIVGIVVAAILVLAAIGSIASPNGARTASSHSATDSPATEPNARSTPSTTATPTPSATPTVPPASTPAAGTALSLLAALSTDASPESHTGYNRDFFVHWSDSDGDGCNTRAEVLITESSTSTSHTGTCAISIGKWFSQYDGVWVTVASQLDIDHFVPLSEAWKSGAYRWSASTRQAFANDLGYAASLIAVTASTNRSKGDQDPARWMPPNAGFACTYVSTWVAVKYRWSLTVDSSERSAISRILGGCGTLKVTTPAKASISIASVSDAAAPAGSGGATTGATTGGNGSNDGKTDPDYGTCVKAKAAGRGPYVKGVDPEYDFYRDGDKDGMVCE